MPDKQKSLNTLVFVISSGSGDGSIVCFEKVSKEIHDYFIENDLSLEDFALDSSYAEENNIPQEMEPFNPGYSATFGSSETGMTASDDL